MPEDKYLRLEERGLLRYREMGDSAKPVVIFLHGVGAGIESWSAQAEYLAKHFFVILIDVIGFGKSRIDDAEYDSKLFVDALDVFVKQNHLEKFSLVGHSLGGFLSLVYANTHPAMVSNLVLIASAGFGKPSKRFIFFSSKFSQLVFLPFVRNRYLGPKIFKYFYGHGLSLSARNALSCHWADLIVKRSFVKVLKQHYEYNSVETTSINCPSLVIWGKRDWILDYRQGVLAAKQLNARLELFDQFGHGVHAEIPEEINSLILEFLATDNDGQ